MKAPLRHSSKKSRPFKIAVAAFGVVLFGWFLPPVISFLAMVVMYPVHATNVWLEESSSLVPTFFRDRQSLETEIQNLKDELVIAGRVDVTQRRLQEENNRLRQLLGAALEERVAAAIIARPNDLPYDLLQIDRGSQQGIEIGAPVFVGDDTVIGLVVHTAPTYAFVELFTTPGFEATAFIEGPNVVATMEGYGGGVARVRVPQGIPIRVGDLVLLPSIEPGVFGRISHLENLPTQPEQYGYITPEIPLSGMFRVAVGRQSQITQEASEIDETVREYLRTQLVVPSVGVGTTSSTTISESSTSTEESAE